MEHCSFDITRLQFWTNNNRPMIPRRHIRTTQKPKSEEASSLVFEPRHLWISSSSIQCYVDAVFIRWHDTGIQSSSVIGYSVVEGTSRFLQAVVWAKVSCLETAALLSILQMSPRLSTSRTSLELSGYPRFATKRAKEMIQIAA